VYNVELQDNPNPDVYWSMAHGGLETYQERHVIKWWLSQHNYVHKHLQGVIGVCLRTYIRWMIGSTPPQPPMCHRILSPALLFIVFWALNWMASLCGEHS
jgi:hypothetical protein